MLGKATKFLGGFTFKFWLAVLAAVAGCIPVAYCKGRSDKDAEWVLRLETAAAKKGVESALAREKATEGADARADEFEHEQETILEMIDEADSAGGNALDAIFGGVSGAD